ncbi:MAG: alginate lyase family protein [Rhodospirillales bacterium]
MFRTLSVATCLLLVTACQADIPEPVPEALQTPTISMPGSVFIPAAFVRENKDLLAARCLRSALPEDPITSVQAPAGYGLDDRYIKASGAIIKMGTGCLGNNDQQCRSVVAMTASWADANASIVNRTATDDGQFWNDTLTVNLYVARPFIGAYSIARARGFSDDAVDLRIMTWMHHLLTRASHMMRDGSFYREAGMNRAPKAAHNHAAASAAAWMAFGAQWNNADAFRHGIEQWFITLRTMREDGSMPIETRRGARAVFYQGRILNALASIAVMADVQGIDLWSQSPGGSSTIHNAVRFMLKAVDDPSVVFPYARENVAPGPDKNWENPYLGSPDGALAWMIPYMHRFPDHPNTAAILNAGQRKGWQTRMITVALNRTSLGTDWLGFDAACRFGKFYRK